MPGAVALAVTSKTMVLLPLRLWPLQAMAVPEMLPPGICVQVVPPSREPHRYSPALSARPSVPAMVWPVPRVVMKSVLVPVSLEMLSTLTVMPAGSTAAALAVPLETVLLPLPKEVISAADRLLAV